jgi:mono/diheme cytochrome c family protein
MQMIGAIEARANEAGANEARKLRTSVAFRQWVAAVVGAFFLALLSLALASCDLERRKSDAELGLNPQQVQGRKIFDNDCDRCHRAYSSKGKKGPGLQGVFKHPYLSVSGLPANDDRVSEIVNMGRKEMPGFSRILSSEDMQDLLAYLHTL